MSNVAKKIIIVHNLTIVIAQYYHFEQTTYDNLELSEEKKHWDNIRYENGSRASCSHTTENKNNSNNILCIGFNLYSTEASLIATNKTKTQRDNEEDEDPFEPS